MFTLLTEAKALLRLEKQTYLYLNLFTKRQEQFLETHIIEYGNEVDYIQN